MIGVLCYRSSGTVPFDGMKGFCAAYNWGQSHIRRPWRIFETWCFTYHACCVLKDY